MDINKLLNKNKELILYLFFGVATTLINVVAYYMFARLLNFNILSSTIIAWVLSVIFAYITNKIWVFQGKTKSLKELVREFISFIVFRLASGGIDVGIMFIFCSLLGFNDLYVKIVSNVIVVILNYVASKLFIFTSKNK